MCIRDRLSELIGLAATSVPSPSGGGQAGIAIPNREERRRGVAVYAGGNMQLYMGSASGALAVGTASVSGVVKMCIRDRLERVCYRPAD